MNWKFYKTNCVEISAPPHNTDPESNGSLHKTIYIIRHGETEFNRKGIVQGKGVDSSINEQGTRQAQQFFEHYRDVQFECIYISSLQRTAQTIAPFRALDIPVIVHNGLDEISWGVHEGQDNEASFKTFYRILHAWRSGDVHEAIAEGESPVQVQQRQQQFIQEMLSRQEKTVLICSHGRAIRILLCTLLNTPLQQMDTFPHQNVSLYKLIYNGQGFKVELFNDTAHLHGA